MRAFRRATRAPRATISIAPMAVIASRLGLDANPIDLTDAADARWLEACVWPDQADRFQRQERAIELFLADPVPVRRGDAEEGRAH